MLLPKKWLCEYVDFNCTNDEFVEKMMWRGFELAGIESELPGVEGVVVGKLLSVADHDNSDHLHICSVDIGEAEPLTIVTGADNVHGGEYVPVALVGAKLDGHVMEPVNMRGVMSYGMLCSGKELGLTDSDYPGSDVHGILILNGNYTLGETIQKALGFDDVIFEFELTPNRPDCASIIGMCREAAAALGQTMKEPTIRDIAGSGNAADYASVTVENFDLCPRYTARVIRDIKIEPSPTWMQRKLRATGFRPINNIVDITNYVLVEYGHPMHAFDLACVNDGHIIVRNAHEGEIVTTLDQQERTVSANTLLIADPNRGVGIAGVMGGLNSEITENTKTVLFESAVFKGSNIRKTTRELHHTTDAAARFIKGVEPTNALLALNRAVELVTELGAGVPIGRTIDVCQEKPVDKTIGVSVHHINGLLALDLSPETMSEMLGTIGIASIPNGDTLNITVPHFRTDIESGIEADWDIAEEIGRIYGFYRITPTLMRGDTFRGGLSPAFRFEDKVKDTLVSLGGYEMYNYNFTGPAALNALKLPDDSILRNTVKILNPFGEDQSLMRTTLIPGMLDVAVRNLNRKTGVTRFFEVANVHFDLGESLPKEVKTIGILMFAENDTFFTMKGLLEQFFSRLGLKNASYARTELSFLQPGRAAKITSADGTELGVFGEIHPDVTANWKTDRRIYVAELRFEDVRIASDTAIRFEPLPRFPVVARDLAVVVDEKAESETFKKLIENAQTDLIVENVTLFDTYAGVGMLPGKKSLAFSFTLRSDDHTLSDDEIKAAFETIIDTLEKNGAPLRS